jgi:soluble lytic murein transglycosylase
MAACALSRPLALLLAVCCTAAGCAGACTNKQRQGGGAVSAAALPSSALVPSAAHCSATADGSALDAAVGAEGAGSLPWIDAVRLGRWAEALVQLDALEGEQRQRAEIRYVRARVALALGRYDEVVGDLRGLEAQLPLLGKDIALYRAEAQIHVGPVEEAAEYLARQTDAPTLLRAAAAWEKAGRVGEARAAIDRAIKVLGRSREELAVEAHALRARIAEASGDRALAASDLRFVATHGPWRDESVDIGEAIVRLDPRRALSASERVDRAQRMARDGDSQAALHELDRVARNSPQQMSKAELEFAKAMALYMDRGHYAQAAEVFEQAAKLDTTLGAEASYRAAKAWARADMNPRAAERYTQVTQRYPRSRWAERAAYQLARLHMLEAHWAQAVTAYSRYRDRYPRGEDSEAARYEHAVSLLLAGQYAQARKAIGALAVRNPDRLAAATLLHLEAVAAFQAGDSSAAFDIWTRLVNDEPLSWPALVASARLRSAGKPTPMPIQPATASARDPLSVTLPEPARLLASIGLERDAEQYLRDNEPTVTASFGSRAAQAQCQLYGSLSLAHRRYRIGLRMVPGSALQSAPSSSSRWAWECLFPSAHGSAVHVLQQRESLPAGLMHAVMRQESGFDPEARSPAGAVGLMQLLPSTARKIADEFSVTYSPEQLLSPWLNLDLAARYLSKLLANFHGELPLAVAAYNAGPKAVARWLQACGDLPLDLWVARIPYAETRHYVEHVMSNYARYAYLLRPEDGATRLQLQLPKGIDLPADSY